MFPHQYRRWCDIIEVRRNKKLLSPHASTTIIMRMMNRCDITALGITKMHPCETLN